MIFKAQIFKGEFMYETKEKNNSTWRCYDNGSKYDECGSQCL